jgi:uncharacterized iron-regulated membrane protein
MSSTIYRAIWRWHFHAGLFCIPFIVVLAITGSIYLFKPQIDAIADRDVDGLTLDGQLAAPRENVAAALAAVPGSQLVDYQLQTRTDDAVRVHVRAKDQTRDIVYVHPVTRAVLKIVPEEARLTEFVKSIHGELLVGPTGSIFVELAACWAIVMIVTGLFLWWPRNAQGLAGVLYPRLRDGKATFWRDLHAVTGLWVSGLVLFLLLTALPWTTVWGGAFKGLRSLGTATEVKQDWTTGRVGGGSSDEHAGHHDRHASMAEEITPGFSLDQVAVKVAALRMAPPVLIAPPTARDSSWTIRSDSQNRALRRELGIDSRTGAILRDQGFADRKTIDRVIAIGISAHEGQLFGLANQLLGLAAALGLITLCVSAVAMWWRNRPETSLGIPARKVTGFKIERALAALIILLALLLPVFGASLIVVAAADRLIFARLARSQPLSAGRT